MALTLTQKEGKIIQMALSSLIEDLTISQADKSIPWTTEAKQATKDMLEVATSAKVKMEKEQGKVIDLEPYKQGDEKEFLIDPKKN